MSHDMILREITSEQELAARHGGDGWDDARRAWYEISQFLQCGSPWGCGGCDPNGPYGGSGSSGGGSSSGGFHC